MGRRKGASGSAAAADSWGHKDERVHVVEREGHRLDLSVAAKIDAPPSLVFDILTEPDPAHAFRGLKEVLYHRILEDNHHGKQKIAIGHRAIARFLFISMTFDTHLYSWEDRRSGKISFELTGNGNKTMKAYDGGWQVVPFSEEAMENWKHKLSDSEPAPTKPSWLGHAAPFLGRFNKPRQQDTSLVTLEHHIVPRIKLPPGLKGILRRFVAKQAQDMMKDLRAEVERVKLRDMESLLPTRKDQDGKRVAGGTASMTLAQPPNFWAMATPFEVVIGWPLALKP